ncbi:MAG TPA: alpha/beta hydrolase [Niastella sp.]
MNTSVQSYSCFSFHVQQLKMILKIMCCYLALLIPVAVFSQKIAYGNNPQAGHYFDVGDARIYYEIYGKGEPFVLLHGGVYGYIDEFEYFIPKLAEKYQVICIATRGHGKSEIGKAPFTYQQRAEDCFKVIRSITKDSVTVLGFSDGGYSGLKLAAQFPAIVKKLIAIGVGDDPKDSVYNKYHYTVAELKKESPKFIESRIKLMPEPDRYDECLAKLNDLYNKDYMSKETFEKIKCPVLVMSGDNDGYSTVEQAVLCAKYIPQHQLSIIPGCHHVVFYCNFPAVWESIQPFLKK